MVRVIRMEVKSERKRERAFVTSRDYDTTQSSFVLVYRAEGYFNGLLHRAALLRDLDDNGSPLKWP